MKRLAKKVLAVFFAAVFLFSPVLETTAAEKKAEFIKWVDFTPTLSALEKAMKLDIETYKSENHLPWIETLAYLASKNGGNFKKFKTKDADAFAEKRKTESITALTEGLKYYMYYHEAYTAVLGGFLGEYEINTARNDEEPIWEKKYGLKAFSPIAKGYDYQDYDDFGAGRDYGFKRKHLGHDLMALTGTPVVAVESGTVEVLGWNRYGGWRVGIRSFDKKRYYYYAHLRKNRPFHADMAEGRTVKAGDVIGYVGRSGYSSKENTNNIKQSHLHFGMQLIFDESQKEGNNEIWIDVYAIVKLLRKNRCETYRVDETKEYYRRYDFAEPIPEQAAIGILTDGDAESEARGEFDFPVIMYHNVTKNARLLGKFSITPYELEDDLKMLTENGFEGITVSQAIDFVETGKPLPSKPVMLTFDDGNLSDYKYVLPLLKKYNQKAVISIIGTVTDKYSADPREDISFPNLTWDMLREMRDSGLVEIQSHGYDMHGPNGSKRRAGESGEDYKTRFTSDLAKLQQRSLEELGCTPTAFAYPLGLMSNNTTDMLIEQGFKSSFSCSEGLNTIKTGDRDSLFRLKRYVRPHGVPVWKILKKAGS